MADEKATLLEQETEEQVTTAEEESEDSESESQEEVESEEETQETEETDVKEYDSEEDYLESQGIGRKTLDQFIAEHKQQQRELDALRTYRAETGFQPQQTQQQQTQAERKFLAAKSLAKKYIESMRFGDDDAGKRAKASYDAMSQLVDSALDPVIDKTEEGLQTVLQGIAAIAKHLQRQSYQSSRHRNLVKFEDIEKDMLGRFELDADKAIRNFIVNNRPDLLAQLQQKAEQEGQRRAQLNKFKKNSAARRQKQSSPGGVDWKPFFTHGEPNDKFASLPTADKLKVAGAYQKAAQRDLEGR